MNKKNKELQKKIEQDPSLIKKRETFEHLHAKPVTRRELLASGLISFSSSLVLPSFLTILARSGHAQAEELICKTVGGLDWAPFISLKLSGGAAMGANFLPLDKGEQLLPSYSKMGMGKGSTLPVSYEFANKAPFYAASQMLAGMRTAAAATTLQKANFCGVCVRSQDDNSQNKFDITGLVINAGASGAIMNNLGRTGSVTGVNNGYAFVPPPAPLIVGSYDDIIGSLGVSGSLAALNTTQKSNLFKTVQNLSNAQVEQVKNMTGGTTLARLLGCANQDNTNLIANTSALNIDPLGNQAFATNWGITNNSSRSSQEFAFASMVWNVINKNASTANLEMGGFDYHNNTRTSGDDRDNDAGTVIGQILQSFAIMNTKGFLVVTSDGSVTSPDSDIPGGVWTSDRGTAGVAFLICYDPAGAHKVVNSQLGNFTTGQAVDDTFITGGSAELAAGAFFANYLAWQGRINLLENFLPRVFSLTDLDKIIKILPDLA